MFRSMVSRFMFLLLAAAFLVIAIGSEAKGADWPFERLITTVDGAHGGSTMLADVDRTDGQGDPPELCTTGMGSPLQKRELRACRFVRSTGTAVGSSHVLHRAPKTSPPR